MSEQGTILIIGGVAAGASAATRARRVNERARIVLIEKDAHVSFANCGLPYYIGGEIADRGKLLVASRELFERRFRVEVRTLTEAVGIDRAKKRVRLREVATGREVEEAYDKLILAPGAVPIVPGNVGPSGAGLGGASGAENVFTLRSLDDADRLHAAVLAAAEHAGPSGSAGRSAVVIGAGFIGLEMAEQLRRRGLAVTVVERAAQVLPVMDPEMASIVQESLVANGVAVRVGDGLRELRRAADGRRVEAAVLESGAEVPGDVFILGIGVRPSTKLASEAGLRLGATGAIAVDAFMRTSDPDIYAAGDAVEYEHGVVAGGTRAALGGPANRAGRIAGEHAATGRARGMAPVLGSAIVRVFELTAGMTGLTERAARAAGIAARAAFVAHNHHAGYYPGAQRMVLKLVYATDGAMRGRVLGAQAVGAAGIDKRIDVMATAIAMRASVFDLAGLDLCYAPPFGSAKDPVHMAAFVAVNDLDGLTPTVSPADDLTGATVVDVRTGPEVERARLAGVRHIELEHLRARQHELDRSGPIVVTCQSGQRAHTATRLLRELGFTNVRNLTGGMLMRGHARPESVVRGPISKA